MWRRIVKNTVVAGSPDREVADWLEYVRGPEGLIVELAERLDGAPG